MKLTNLGTPDNPDRSNSLHARYWEGYFGFRRAAEFPKGSAARICVQQGIMARKADEKADETARNRPNPDELQTAKSLKNMAEREGFEHS